LSRQLLLSLLLLTPLLFLLYRLFGNGVEDPIKYIYTLTGATALLLLLVTTSISLMRPLANLIRYRRTVGLFAFFYALLHMSNFIVLDMELDLAFAFTETLDKPFIYLGMIAFAILLFMASTSTKQGFAKYARYHKAIYLAIILATVHFVMAQKSLSLGQWGYLAGIGIIAVLKLLQRSGIVKF
jgi:sulfoxide reductase heme-binding subunit YedZ